MPLMNFFNSWTPEPPLPIRMPGRAVLICTRIVSAILLISIEAIPACLYFSLTNLRI
jgi:hypothetical protein